MYIKRKKGLKKKLLVCVVALVIIASGYLIYAKSENIWPLKSYQSDTPTISEPKINHPTSDKDMRQKKDTNLTQGNSSTDGTGMIDSEGAGIDKKQSGIGSASGLITLFNVKENQKLTNGMTIAGKSGLSTVQYRLKDNVHGVIGQGQLNVKEGAFSGTLKINTNATSGTLELYSFDNQGREINSIKVEVRY